MFRFLFKMTLHVAVVAIVIAVASQMGLFRYVHLPFDLPSLRSLVRYWVAIVHGMSLFTSDEMKSLTDTELFVQAFQRAKENKCLELLWNAIEAEAKS
jgi:hypothetical protein